MKNWFERLRRVFHLVPWEDEGVAQVFLEQRSPHLGTLLRESIDDVPGGLDPEIIALVAEDWVLYER